MRKILRRRPSPALVVSIIALVVASAGSASALQGGAARAPKFVVGSYTVSGHVPKDGDATAIVHCPSTSAFAGTRAVSGGYVVNSGFVYAIESRVVLPNEYRLTLSYPPTIYSENGADYSATIYCAKIK
jgi:hypothetical protein